MTWHRTQLASWFDTELKADLAGWLHLSLLFSCLSSLTCIRLLNTMKCSAAQPVTVVERQPVLSVFSTLAFSWLRKTFVSLLHQYAFVDVTISYNIQQWPKEKKKQKMVTFTLLDKKRCMSHQLLNHCLFSFNLLFKHLGQSCLANVQRNPK